MSAHHSFVVVALGWLLVIIVAVSHLVVETTSRWILALHLVATSWIKVSASSAAILVISSAVLLTSSESTPTPASITSATSSPLVAVVPLYALERKLHYFRGDLVIWLSQF